MNIKWDSEEYTENFDFVHKYGEDVLNLIEAPRGSMVVDLGCGNGALSQKLLEKGYRVLGLDASEEMVNTARNLHPDITFQVADATTFRLDEKADVIFSNAVFHWIDGDKQEQLIENISENLVSGGSLVCEFGGFGCAETVHRTLEKHFIKRGFIYARSFYFPTIGEYAPLLEKHHLLVESATLFERPTLQKTKNGLKDWINMFVKIPFEGMDEAMKNEIINATDCDLKNTLYTPAGCFVDYVRIRIKAKKK